MSKSVTSSRMRPMLIFDVSSFQVDHAGRCCRVKWFRTYTEGAAPQPIYCSTTDASVYDLKDHPDFKFRPGSIVIRVMNKAGDDCGLGAGQVLDNQSSGQVGKTSRRCLRDYLADNRFSGECVVGF